MRTASLPRPRSRAPFVPRHKGVDSAPQLVVPQQHPLQTSEKGPRIFWKAIEHRSVKLLSGCESDIRNTRLRCLARIALHARSTAGLTAQEFFESSNVVYVVFETSHNVFYIGNTEKNVLQRLREHWYRRTTPHSHTRLSALFAASNLHIDRTVYCFPLCIITDSVQRQDMEFAYIRQYQVASGLLNKAERHHRHRRCNRNGAARPTSRLLHDPTMPQNRMRSIVKLTAYLNTVPAKKRHKVIAQLSKARLNDLLQQLPESAGELRSLASQFVFNFPRRIGTGSVRQLVLQGAPFPKEILQRARCGTKLSSTLGAQAKNCTDMALVMPGTIFARSEDTPSSSRRVPSRHCFCTSLELGGTPHLRQGHIATNDVSVLSGFLLANGVSQDVIRELILVWGQGAKFRGCKSVEHSLELFQESLDNFAMRLSDATPLEMALSDAFKQAVLAWKSAVLDRYRALCEADTRNFAVRADVSRAIRLLRDNFVIAPMDKNPQSLVILCSDNYCSRLQEHLSSPVYSAATFLRKKSSKAPFV